MPTLITPKYLLARGIVRSVKNDAVLWVVLTADYAGEFVCK